MILKGNNYFYLFAAAVVIVFCVLNFCVADSASAGEYLPGSTQYVVASGDTLYGISCRFGVSVEDLKRTNGLYADLIYPGMVLTIPARTSGYVVRSGDTLFLIARAYGVSIDELKRANGLQSDLIMVGQVLIIPEKVKSLSGIFAERGITDPARTLEIIVDKTDHILSVYWQGVWLKSYHVELADGGLGDKEIAGDHKTPEGSFYITEKLVLDPEDEYLGTRWMRLSYPNIEDAYRGLQQKLIDWQTYNAVVAALAGGKTPPQDTPLGGGIGIHGGSKPEFGSDWTWGCIGMTNADVEDIYDCVDVGTRVIIQR